MANIYVYEDVDYYYIQSMCSFLKDDFFTVDDIIAQLSSSLESDVKSNVINALNQINKGGFNGSISTMHKKLDKISNAMESFPNYHRALMRYENCDDDDEDKYYRRVVKALNSINNKL